MKKPKLTIELQDGLVYTAGDTLRGTLILEATREFRGEKVSLLFAGEDRLYARAIGGLPGLDVRRAFFTKKIKINHSKTLLLQHNEDGKILPGRYVFDFSLKLPADLPSNMKIVGGKSYCIVQYSLKAAVKKSEVVGVCDVQVRAQPFDKLVPFNCQATTVKEHAKLFSVFDAGPVVMQVQGDTSQIPRGGSTPLTVVCNSSLGIRKVSVQLLQEEHRRIDELDSSHTTKSWHSKTILHQVKDGKGSQTEYSGTFTVPNAYSSHDDNSAVENTGKLHNSHDSKLFSVKHFLVIRAHLKMSTDAPKIMVPVQIGEPLQSSRF